MNLIDNKYYRKALEFISTEDLSSLAPGKHVLDGENLWVNIVDTQLKKPAEARLEVHNAYIDIQVPISGPESYGVKPRSECSRPSGGFDSAGDIQFFDDPVEQIVSAVPGQPVTFTPDMAHAPLIGSGPIHKAIFKVKAV